MRTCVITFDYRKYDRIIACSCRSVHFSCNHKYKSNRALIQSSPHFDQQIKEIKISGQERDRRRRRTNTRETDVVVVRRCKESFWLAIIRPQPTRSCTLVALLLPPLPHCISILCVRVIKPKQCVIFISSNPQNLLIKYSLLNYKSL
jgi:hypothetical protein